MSIDQKFHISNQTSNPFGFFSFLNFFRFPSSSLIQDRTPYPILKGNPTVREIFENLSKGDVMMYAFTMGCSFLVSNYTLSNMNILKTKLFIHHWNMHIANLFGICLAFFLSESRLRGRIDNGLRWKGEFIEFNKYDFTSEFEKKSIYRHLNEKNNL